MIVPSKYRQQVLITKSSLKALKPIHLWSLESQFQWLTS